MTRSLAPSRTEAISVCIVALPGDEPLLAATLAQCQGVPREALWLLSPPGSGFEEIARELGCLWLGALPLRLQPERYWCEVGEALGSWQGNCWVIRAGTRLPGDWERRLALSEPDLVAVFPLSLRFPCTSLFLSTRHQPGLDLSSLDRWLNQYLGGLCWDIPLFDGQTALLCPPRLPRGVKDDYELASFVRRQGGVILASDNLLVDDRHLTAASLPEGLPSAWSQAILHRHPLTSTRHALTELSARGEVPPMRIPAVRRAALHICHGWGGGLWHWVEDFVGADQHDFSYVLKPVGDWSAFGQSFALYAADDLQQPLQSWTLSLPILSTSDHHFEYRSMLEAIVETYGIEVLLVSSLIGHALDVLRTQLPTLLVVHDFFPACPAIVATWGRPCMQCDDARLAACLGQNPEHRYFLHQEAAHWQALRMAFVHDLGERRPLVVVPSASVAERLRGLLPGLSDMPVHVIPHGLPEPLLETFSPVLPEPLEGRRPRVLVLGSLNSHKGGDLLREIIPALGELAEVHLWGCGDSGREWEGQPHVTILPKYQRSALGGLLNQLKPDLGLLLSVVPETFSYTLSELQAASIPTLATRLGAFADRIEEDRTGWLVAPNGADVLAQLHLLFSEPQRLVSVREHLAAIPRRSAADMVHDYLELVPAPHGLLRRPRSGLTTAADACGAVVINPDARTRAVLRGFLGYLQGKVETSPRLPEFSRKYLRHFIGWLLR